MYTLEGLNEEYIKQIYMSTVLYSIKQYQLLPEELKIIYNKKYQNALIAKEELQIEDNQSLEELRFFLQQQKEKIETIKAQNQPIIDLLAAQTIDILINEMPNNSTQLQKCEYIFDYITNTMEYSNDWYRYCKDVPPTSGYEFSFYHGIPLSNTYEGLLVTRQGICDDIANLITYLGKRIGVNIEKITCDHNENLHAINYIEINGIRSYFDATSVILKNKTKEESFLVSEEFLNKDGDYKFKENIPSTTIEKELITYDINEVINKTNKLIPQTNYINYNKYEK